MKNKFIRFLIFISLFFNCSCAIDPINTLTIINKSKSNYALCYVDSKNDSLAQEKSLQQIIDLYNIWIKDSVNQDNYLTNEKYNSIFYIITKDGGSGEIEDSYHDVIRFNVINIDMLYHCFQKGLPVDSFRNYEIKDFPRGKLMKEKYHIILY